MYLYICMYIYIYVHEAKAGPTSPKGFYGLGVEGLPELAISNSCATRTDDGRKAPNTTVSEGSESTR